MDLRDLDPRTRPLLTGAICVEEHRICTGDVGGRLTDEHGATDVGGIAAGPEAADVEEERVTVSELGAVREPLAARSADVADGMDQVLDTLALEAPHRDPQHVVVVQTGRDRGRRVVGADGVDLARGSEQRYLQGMLLDPQLEQLDSDADEVDLRQLDSQQLEDL